MDITKAIILAAGWGTRRLPVTKVIEKNMIPVGNRPIIDYVVEDCIKAGIKDIYFVISENLGESQIRAYYSRNEKLEDYLTRYGKKDKIGEITVPEGINFHYTVQPEGKYGTAVPIALVADEFGLDEPVVVAMGDAFFYDGKGGSEITRMINAVSDGEDSAILGIIKEESELSKYGVLNISNDGNLVEIVEKPKVENAPSNLINSAYYVLSGRALQITSDFVKNNDFGTEKEYYLTDTVTDFVKEGGIMRVVSNVGEYLDGGSLDGWIYANDVVGRDLLKS